MEEMKQSQKDLIFVKSILMCIDIILHLSMEEEEIVKWEKEFA